MKHTTIVRGQHRPRCSPSGIPTRMLEDGARLPVLVAVDQAMKPVRERRLAEARAAVEAGTANDRQRWLVEEDDRFIRDTEEREHREREAQLAAEQADARVKAEYEAARDRVDA